MKISKLLAPFILTLPAVVVPLGIATTGCASAWGHKNPISTGSMYITDPNNPYYKFVGNDEYRDMDGLSIPKYLPSNYITDQAKGINYSYATPVDKWYKTEDKKSYKLPTNEWVDGSSTWMTTNTTTTNQISEIVNIEGKDYSVIQSCAKNITLSANIAFVNSISQFINKYVTYAISYCTSQLQKDVPYDQNKDLAIAFGGTTPKVNDADVELFYEWLCSNANYIIKSQPEAFMRTTNVNFNFENFPIPAYDADKKISKVTAKLLTGKEDVSALSSEDNPYYWSDKKEYGEKDEEKYTVYTYPAVPILIRATNLTQRFTNPKVSDSFFVNDYYQNDKSKIDDAVGDSWKQITGHDVTPTMYKFDISTHGSEAKKLSFGEGDKFDKRIAALEPRGCDFIAFVTYSFVDWKIDGQDPKYNRNDSVTLNSLQTVMPAYMLELQPCTELFKKVRSDQDNAGYIMDTTKADKYSTELIQLLGRQSAEGRKGKATELNSDSQKYLWFLSYLFGKQDTEFTFDFVHGTEFAQ